MKDRQSGGGEHTSLTDEASAFVKNKDEGKIIYLEDDEAIDMVGSLGKIRWLTIERSFPEDSRVCHSDRLLLRGLPDLLADIPAPDA